jgi:hypothetical protein
MVLLTTGRERPDMVLHPAEKTAGHGSTLLLERQLQWFYLLLKGQPNFYSLLEG